MTYTPTHEQRIRQKLLRMEHDDRREAAQSTHEAMERNLRATLNASHPDTSPEEIERLVGLVKSRWSAPTTSVVKSAPGIPQHVLAARCKERKAIVAAGKHLRRG